MLFWDFLYMKKIILFLLTVAFLSLPFLGQEIEEKNLTIKTDESILIDGLLNELIWGKTPEANTFIQYKPDIIIAGTKKGLNLIRNDSVIKQYKMADGLPDNLIFNMYKDEDEVLWIATNTGISRFENESFINY